MLLWRENIWILLKYDQSSSSFYGNCTSCPQVNQNLKLADKNRTVFNHYILCPYIFKAKLSLIYHIDENDKNQLKKTL